MTPCRVIVGIMEDTRYSTLEDGPTPMFFVPMAQGPGWAMRTLFVRPKGEPDAAIAAVRRTLHQIEPGLPHATAQLLRSRVDPQLQPWRLGSTLFTAFGVLAVVMSGLGLYGVVAYDVAHRRREFGVRTAFGARATTIVSLVLRDAGRVILIGLAVDVRSEEGMIVMRLLSRLRSIRRGLTSRSQFEVEMDEELRHHVELRARDLVASGVAPPGRTNRSSPAAESRVSRTGLSAGRLQPVSSGS